MLDGELLTREALRFFERALTAERALDERILDAVRGFPADAEPMSALRTGVSALGPVDPDHRDDEPEANVERRSA